MRFHFWFIPNFITALVFCYQNCKSPQATQMLGWMLSYGCPEDVAPFITEEKLYFALSRWLQSWLGGVCLRRALKDHIKVNVFQITVFLFPPLLGAALSPVPLNIEVKSIVFSFCVLALVVILQSMVFLIRRNSQVPRRLTRKSIDDTDTHVNNKLFSSLVLEMLIPTKSLVEEGFDIALTFAMSTMCMHLLSVSEMGTYCHVYSHSVIVENVLGWSVFAVSQYPLSARPPIEVNEWHIGRPVALDTSQRAIYVVLLSALDWGLKSSSQLLWARVCVRYCIYLSPLLINFGVLPPISALIEYVIEQFLMIGYGYNPKEDRVLLILFLLVYVLATVILVYISLGNFGVAVSPAFAVVFGRWIGSSYLRQLKESLSKYFPSTTIMPFDSEYNMVSPTDFKEPNSRHSQPWRKLLYSRQVVSYVRCGTVCAIGAIIITLTRNLSSTQRKLLQQVMMTFSLGIWIVLQLRLRLELATSYLRKYLCSNVSVAQSAALALDWALRLSLWLLISVYISNDSSNLFDTAEGNAVWKSIALLHVWTTSQQNPYQAFPTIWPASVLASYCSLSFSSSIFIAALAQTRLQHFLELLHFMGVIVSSVLISSKQRFPGWIMITLAGLPVSLLSLAFSTLFLSPLYPFCGSTLFLAAFPRPRRFWYAYEICHDNKDAAYYEHMFDALTRDLHNLLSTDAFLHQRSTCSRDVYFIRADNYLAMLEILELGVKHCVVRFKGLELQETTSCHHLEASKLDDAIQEAFGDNDSHSSDDDEEEPPSRGHPLRLNIFTPLVRVPMRMYSVSNAVLTGFIDEPGCIQVISQAFWMTLVTELNRVAHGSVPEIWLSSPVSVSSLDFVLKEFPTHYWDYLQAKNKKHLTKAELRSPQSLPRVNQISAEDGTQREPRRSSLKLAATAFLKIVMHLKPVRSSMTVTPTLSAAPFSVVQADTPSQKARFQVSSQAYGLQEDENTDTVNYDTLIKQRPTVIDGRKSFLWGDIDGHVPESSKSTTKLTRPSFLKERWNKVSDFHMLAASCYAIVQTLGYGTHDVLGASHVYQCFHGDFPKSLENDWLKANTTLYDIVVRAYRLAVKFGLDKFAEGDSDIYDLPEEVESIIACYQTKWYIGPRNGLVWKRHITANRSNLFALSKNSQGNYVSSIYTLRTQEATVVSVNRSACEGIWAGLGLELLYMTNDDDERFSIQSNPQLLRNLLVQSADPPLGYPVFSTGAVMVKF